MKALIDGDIIRYQVGYACEDTIYWVYDLTFPEGDPHRGVGTFKTKKDAERWVDGNDEYEIVETRAAERMDTVQETLDLMLKRILFRTEANDYVIYFSNERNIRKETYSDYKANRDSAHKPLLYQRIGSYLVDNWNARYAREGLEADDELGINQNEDTIIVSTDKDLDTIAGWHYNWVRDRKYFIDTNQASYNFWTQMLVGDSSDNIKGLPRIGPVTAKKWLNEVPNEHFEEFVLDKYKEYNLEKDFDKNKYLLTIRQQYEESV